MRDSYYFGSMRAHGGRGATRAVCQDWRVVDLDRIRADLADEHASLDEIVAVLNDASWDLPTPAEPWSVRDQISHLAFFDELATAASTRADDFTAGLATAAQDVDAYMNAPLQKGRAMDPTGVLEWWRAARTEMLDAFATLPPDTRILWYGPPMSPASFITARLMETWAHGQDVVDAIGVERTPTDRLRHVAHIGVRARPFSYSTRGLAVPEEPIAVDLEGPGGARWTWNEEADQRVVGEALEFCLVVTQRRHVDDTALAIEGPLAREWMSIAQAYAGPPGTGRKPGQFARGAARA